MLNFHEIAPASPTTQSRRPVVVTSTVAVMSAIEMPCYFFFVFLGATLLCLTGRDLSQGMWNMNTWHRRSRV